MEAGALDSVSSPSVVGSVLDKQSPFTWLEAVNQKLEKQNGLIIVREDPVQEDDFPEESQQRIVVRVDQVKKDISLHLLHPVQKVLLPFEYAEVSYLEQKIEFMRKVQLYVQEKKEWPVSHVYQYNRVLIQYAAGIYYPAMKTLRRQIDRVRHYISQVSDIKSDGYYRLKPQETGLDCTILRKRNHAVMIPRKDVGGNVLTKGSYKTMKLAISVSKIEEPGKCLHLAWMTTRKFRHTEETILKKIAKLTDLDHYFLRIYAVEYYKTTKSDEEKQGILAEFCDGGKMDIETCLNFSWSKRITLFLQLLKTVKILHEKLGYLHRDLKPNNILFKINNEGEHEVRLIDFGLSSWLGLTKTCAYDDRGTANYLAPEIWKEHSVTPKSEVFSLGVVALQAIFCKRPSWHDKDYRKENVREFMLDSWKNKTNRSGINPLLSPIHEAVYKMMEPRPKERMTLDQAIANFERVLTTQG